MCIYIYWFRIYNSKIYELIHTQYCTSILIYLQNNLFPNSVSFLSLTRNVFESNNRKILQPSCGQM